MSEKSSNEGATMRELIVAVAGQRQWSDTRESWLARAARKAGVSYRQAKAIYYNEIKDPNHRSVRLMRDAAELAQQYEIIARGLNEVDAAINHDDVRALVYLAHTLRNLGKPGRGRGG